MFQVLFHLVIWLALKCSKVYSTLSSWELWNVPRSIPPCNLVSSEMFQGLFHLVVWGALKCSKVCSTLSFAEQFSVPGPIPPCHLTNSEGPLGPFHLVIWRAMPVSYDQHRRAASLWNVWRKPANRNALNELLQVFPCDLSLLTGNRPVHLSEQWQKISRRRRGPYRPNS